MNSCTGLSSLATAEARWLWLAGFLAIVPIVHGSRFLLADGRIAS
jgi:hypothetical protein